MLKRDIWRPFLLENGLNFVSSKHEKTEKWSQKGDNYTNTFNLDLDAWR